MCNGQSHNTVTIVCFGPNTCTLKLDIEQTGAPSNICNGLWYAGEPSHDFIGWAKRKVFAMIYEQHEFAEIYGISDLEWYILLGVWDVTCALFFIILVHTLYHKQEENATH